MKYYLSFLLFISTSLCLLGQDIKEYRGKMKMQEPVNQYILDANGTGYYQYYLSEEGKRVKHGKYEFTSEGNTATVIGQFKDGKKTGLWTIKYGLAIESLTEDVNYGFNISFNYCDDLLNGKGLYEAFWKGSSFKANEFSIGRIGYGVHWIVQCSFKDNHFDGRIVFSWPDRKDLTLTGQFDDQGLADGVWEYTDAPISQCFVYKHGIRDKAYQYDDSTGDKESLELKKAKAIEGFFEDSIFSIGGYVQYVEPCFIFSEKRSWQSSSEAKASIDEDGRIIDEEVLPFQLVQEKPKFNGEDANAFQNWIKQNVQYPYDAKNDGIQGRVTVEFIIHSDGSVSDAKVLRGVSYSLDKEAIRVISNSPKWTPGYEEGRPVAVKMTIPVIFQL